MGTNGFPGHRVAYVGTDSSRSYQVRFRSERVSIIERICRIKSLSSLWCPLEFRSFKLGIPAQVSSLFVLFHRVRDEVNAIIECELVWRWKIAGHRLFCALLNRCRHFSGMVGLVEVRQPSS